MFMELFFRVRPWVDTGNLRPYKLLTVLTLVSIERWHRPIITSQPHVTFTTLVRTFAYDHKKLSNSHVFGLLTQHMRIR